MISTKSYMAKPSTIVEQWLCVDATEQPLGRLASKIATHLRGKHLAEYTPHQDMRVYVVVTNAKKISVSGNKLTEKFYHRYSGYQSGMRSISLQEMLDTHPERVIYYAVKNMLSKGALASRRLSRLKIYADEAHPHAAQQPVPLI